MIAGLAARGWWPAAAASLLVPILAVAPGLGVAQAPPF